MSGMYLFANEPSEQQALPEDSWKILIVDDEPEVHAVTKLALSDFQFLGRGLEFHSAYSGAEAKELIKLHPDAAIVLLDVVMETDDAGLNVARYIRDELGNRYTRIILRTGQPGQAPERTVIINYDINDYKSKTELTAQKLFTAVMSSLRSYRDIISIAHSRDGLEKIVASMSDLFAMQSMEHFISGLVQQLSWLIGGARQTLYAAPDKRKNNGALCIRAAYGEDAAQLIGQPIKAALPKDALIALSEVTQNHGIYYGKDFVLAYCPSECRPQGALLCLTGLSRPLNEKEQELLQLFSDNVQLALDNVIHLQDTDELLSNLIGRLLELEQAHYALYPKEHSIFVRVVAKLTELLKLPPDEQQRIGTAATLYERAERLFIECETNTNRVSSNQKRILKAIRPLQLAPNEEAKITVRALEERLERFDGLGLPEGKAGQEIALESALFNIANSLCEFVEQALPVEDILVRLEAECGYYFSPEIFQLVSENAQDIYRFMIDNQTQTVELNKLKSR